MSKFTGKSPWVVHFNCNSCNGCDIEFLACLTPLYDAERFGVLHVGNPKHADILVVTGSVNKKNMHVLKNVYDQIPSPKAVVAMGVCAATGGLFADCYNVVGGIDKVIPVDVHVPGCPPKPEAMLDGIVKAVEILKKKTKETETVTEELPVVIVKPKELPAEPAAPATAKESEK
ncbi:MAG: NADH-quinone oxidoreductase subunit NuoB [Lentisphaerae bacterium]|nr:NADH-quinone oxidoreductase subunit NuoB [Lentisphaerota bacterium]